MIDCPIDNRLHQIVQDLLCKNNSFIDHAQNFRRAFFSTLLLPDDKEDVSKDFLGVQLEEGHSRPLSFQKLWVKFSKPISFLTISSYNRSKLKSKSKI